MPKADKTSNVGADFWNVRPCLFSGSKVIEMGATFFWDL